MRHCAACGNPSERFDVLGAKFTVLRWNTRVNGIRYYDYAHDYEQLREQLIYALFCAETGTELKRHVTPTAIVHYVLSFV